MSKHGARLKYPNLGYHIIFQNSFNDDEFYGLDEFERKKLRIIQARYGCRHCFHTLPDKVHLDLHKFVWNEREHCFEVEDKKVSIQLNTLEEAIVEYIPGEEVFE